MFLNFSNVAVTAVLCVITQSKIQQSRRVFIELIKLQGPSFEQHMNSHARKIDHLTQNLPFSLIQRKLITAEMYGQDSDADWDRRAVAVQEGINDWEQRKHKEWYFFMVH
jgi:hypothetical protein